MEMHMTFQNRPYSIGRNFFILKLLIEVEQDSRSYLATVRFYTLVITYAVTL